MMRKVNAQQALPLPQDALPKERHEEDFNEAINESPLLLFIWETYFSQATGVALEDKIDHFAKIAKPVLNYSRHTQTTNEYPPGCKKLEAENEQLKSQLLELKQQKNRCEERIIELSNKIYDI